MSMDAIDPNSVVWHQSPNPASWPVTKTLEGIEFDDSGATRGVRPITNAHTWPEVIPSGWDGPITHSLWMGRKVGSRWHGASLLEFYRGKDWTGAPLSRHYADWHAGRGYGELETLGNVVPGELLLFMVAAGSHRLKDTSTQPGHQSPRERSPIIVVPYQLNGVVMAQPGQPGPQPQPTPVPASTVDARVAALEALAMHLGERAASVEQAVKDISQRVGAIEAKGPHEHEIPQLPTEITLVLFGRQFDLPVKWKEPPAEKKDSVA